MKLRRFFALAALAAALSLSLAPAGTLAKDVKTPIQPPVWTGNPSGEQLAKRVDDGIAKAKTLVAKALAVKGKRTVDNTLQTLDDAYLELEAVGSLSGLAEQTSPDSAVRAAAEAADQRVSAYYTELGLHRGIYDALSSMDLTGADDETRYYVTRTLRDYKLNGVDRDEATRARVTELRKQLVEIGQAFSKNIRADRRFVTVKDAGEMDGLPADYIARKKPGDDGLIKITVEYPDAFPVFDYAKNEDLRKRLYMEYTNRGYPANMSVLDSMLSKRFQLARLLGFDNWADYITADKMVGSGKNASDFIDRIVEASGPGSKREYEQLLRRKQQDVPGAKDITLWENLYWTAVVKKSEYDFDPQQLRPYFPYTQVRQGVFDITGKLFGVSFRKVENAPVWHPSVECYELIENGQVTGRFYLDMHPRPNKYQHAAHFRVRSGVKGRQIPESALVCNMPGGIEGDPGLMEQDQVETFFHEFGHLLHAMFAGQHRWVGVSGVRTERDFVEAPSQMLEEWLQEPYVLATFGKHYQTGEAVPAELVRKMVRANEFGKALTVRRQMMLARTSLSYYNQPPSQVNTTEIVRDLQNKYLPYAFVDGSHFQCAFGHLDGYSAVYYTYMWSLVIAKDLFAQFDRKNLLDPATPARYRAAILAPGGSKPAAKLVEDFLGRPFNEEAYRAWLNQDVN